jgi:hypothetical protein
MHPTRPAMAKINPMMMRATFKPFSCFRIIHACEFAASNKSKSLEMARW